MFFIRLSSVVAACALATIKAVFMPFLHCVECREFKIMEQDCHLRAEPSRNALFIRHSYFWKAIGQEVRLSKSARKTAHRFRPIIFIIAVIAASVAVGLDQPPLNWSTLIYWKLRRTEPLPDVGPPGWRLSGVVAHGGLMSDEQFMSVTGDSLSIALCGSRFSTWSALQGVQAATSIGQIGLVSLALTSVANVRFGSTTAENTVANSRLLYPRKQTLTL